MQSVDRWARLQPLGRYGWHTLQQERVGVLRRGAWYPVLDDERIRWVVLDLIDRELTVPSELLEFRNGQPRSFSVVGCSDQDPNPVRGTAADLGSLYAVCPQSHDRVGLHGRPHRLTCPDCGAEYPVERQPIC